MSGVGVLAWIGIGAAAGWAVSRVMVGAEGDALRGTAAGMIGAVLGGLGMRLLDSPVAIGSNILDTLVAALAGSLWLAWITCVVTSGPGARRASFSTRGPLQTRRVIAPVEKARPMLTYAAAREQLVDQLLRDAMAHDAERYDEIGRRFDGVERALPRGGAPELGKLRVALTFWDGWIDARNRGWQLDGAVAKAEWPVLARIVAADLEGDRDVTDVRVVTSFDVATFPPPGNRVQSLAQQLHAG